MFGNYTTYIGKGSVQILDFRDNLFFEQNQSEPFFFNLCEGDYKYVGNISKSNVKLQFNVVAPKDIVKLPKDVRVEFCDGIDSGELHVDDGIIKLENTYLYTPNWIVNFAFFHEWGHYLYPSKNGIPTKENELKCDIFSAIFMLIKGYNPNQIDMAQNHCVNDGTGKNISPELAVQLREWKKFRKEGMMYFLKGLTYKFARQ